MVHAGDLQELSGPFYSGTLENCSGRHECRRGRNRRKIPNMEKILALVSGFATFTRSLKAGMAGMAGIAGIGC